MNAHFSYPEPEPDTPELRQAAAEQPEGVATPGSIPWQTNPQQQFREYVSPGRGAASPPRTPAYTMPGFYQQPGMGGQPGAPGQSASQGYAGYPPQPGVGAPGYPPQTPGYMGYPQPGITVPGYSPQPGITVPGYAPQPEITVPGYTGQMPGSGYYPGYYPYAPPAGYPGYSGYLPYGYPWYPVYAKPKRNGYQLAVGITAFACSCLVIIGGIGSLLMLGLFDLASTTATISGSTYFASVILLLTFALAGIVGGGFCLYHSMRSLFFQKASKTIWLPRFWIFLLCYLATLGLGFWLQTQGLDTNDPVFMGVLVYLGGIFPALTVMTLGIRRLSLPKASSQQLFWRRWIPLGWRGSRAEMQWPTTWRRLTLALVSGATLSILLASVLELLLELVLLGSQYNAISSYISDPNSGNPPPALYGMLLVMLSVIAPLVEELVKPLAVVVLIGRVKNKAEAFTLGLACGIGFNLIETTGYISSGYRDWLTIALVRSGAGLLHGFGAAMVALGWYYLTHKEEGTWLRRTLIAFGCGGYAVLQHALWNGSVALALLPGSIGDFFQNWSWSLGPFVIDGIELVNILEMIGILIFFIYMAGRLRARPEPQSPEPGVNGARIAPVQGTM